MAYLFGYYRKPIRAQFLDRVVRPIWRATQNFEEWRYGRYVRLAIIVVVLILPATPISTVEPVIAAKRLEKSNVGLVPGLDSGLQGSDPAYRFREVSNRIEKLIQSRKPGDIESLTEAQDSLKRIVENVRLPQDVAEAAKLELASLQSYLSLSQIGAEDPRLLSQISSSFTPGMPMVIGAGPDKTRFILGPAAAGFTITDSHPKFFSDFGVISFGHNPGTPIPQLAVTNGDNTSTTFNNVWVQGLAQDIGNLTWTNVVFQGCLIRYHGQPLRLGNVTFRNCTFERSKDGSGQDLLDYLSKHQDQPVSALCLQSRADALLALDLAIQTAVAGIRRACVMRRTPWRGCVAHRLVWFTMVSLQMPGATISPSTENTRRGQTERFPTPEALRHPLQTEPLLSFAQSTGYKSINFRIHRSATNHRRRKFVMPCSSALTTG